MKELSLSTSANKTLFTDKKDPEVLNKKVYLTSISLVLLLFLLHQLSSISSISIQVEIIKKMPQIMLNKAKKKNIKIIHKCLVLSKLYALQDKAVLVAVKSSIHDKPNVWPCKIINYVNKMNLKLIKLRLTLPANRTLKLPNPCEIHILYHKIPMDCYSLIRHEDH